MERKGIPQAQESHGGKRKWRGTYVQFVTAGGWDEEEEAVCQVRHSHLRLANTHRLDQHHVVASHLEQQRALVPPGRHRAHPMQLAQKINKISPKISQNYGK